MTQIIELVEKNTKKNYFKYILYVQEGREKHEHVKERWKILKKVKIELLGSVLMTY